VDYWQVPVPSLDVYYDFGSEVSPKTHMLKAWSSMQQWTEVEPLRGDRIKKALASSVD
jgi:hypothetical protein